ncbi:MAG: hypothetical protein ACRDT0_12005 [Pseudonocardiaceae bacterium]
MLRDAGADFADVRALAAGPMATLREITPSEARGIVEPALPSPI